MGEHWLRHFRIGTNSFAYRQFRAARRVVIGVVGFTVLLLGLALLVLPGPAFIVIPVGLGILAIEFEWARRWLQRVRAFAANANRPASEHESS
jgi:tellurite resistance protein TerC